MARNGLSADRISKIIYVTLVLSASIQFAATEPDKRVKSQEPNSKRSPTSFKDSQQSAKLSGGQNSNIDNDRSGHSARGSSNLGNESESPALNTFLENVLKAQNELKWIDQAARRVNQDDRSSRFRGKRGFDESSGTAWLPQKRKYANGSTSVSPERVYLEKEMANKRNADWDDFDGSDRYRRRLNGPVYEQGTMDDQPLKDWTSGEGSPRSTSDSLNPNRDFERGRDNRLDRWSPDYEAVHKSGDVDLSRGREDAFNAKYARLNARDERETQQNDDKILNSQDKNMFAKSKCDGAPISLGSLEKMVLDLKKSLKNGEKTDEKFSDSVSHGSFQTHDQRHQRSNDLRSFASGNVGDKSNWWSDPRPAEEIFDFKRRANDREDRDAGNVEHKEWRRKRSGQEDNRNEQRSNVDRTEFQSLHREKHNSDQESDRKRRSNRSIPDNKRTENKMSSLNLIPMIEEPHVDLEDVVDAKTSRRIANADLSKSTDSYAENSDNSSTFNVQAANMPEIFGMSAVNGLADLHVESSTNRTGKNELKGWRGEENSGERSSTLPRANSDSSNNSSTDRIRAGPKDNSAQSFQLARESPTPGGSPMNTVGRQRTQSKEGGRSKEERKKEANVESDRRQEVIKVFEPQGRLRQDSAGTKASGWTNAKDERDEGKDRGEEESLRRKLSQQVSREEGINVDASSPASDAAIMKDPLMKSEGGSCGNETAPSSDESMEKFDMEKRIMEQENRPPKIVATRVEFSVHQLRVTPSEEEVQGEDVERSRPCDRSKFGNGTNSEDIDTDSVSTAARDNQEATQEKEVSDKKLNVENSDEFFKGLSKLAKNLMVKDSDKKQSKLIKTDNDLMPSSIEERARNWQSGGEQKSASKQRELRDRNLVRDPENKSGRNIERSEMAHGIDTGFDARDKNSFNSVEINSPSDKTIMEVITGSNRGKNSENVDELFSGTLENSVDDRQSRQLNDHYGKRTDPLNSRYEPSNRDENIESDPTYQRQFGTKSDKFRYDGGDSLKRVEGSNRKLLWSSASSAENERDNAEERSDGHKYANEDIEGAENYVEEEEKAIVDESGDELHLPMGRRARSLSNQEVNPLKARVDMLIRQRMSSKDPANHDYVRKRRYPLGTIEYYDYDSEVDGQDEKASAISSEQNRANLDNGSARLAIKSDREKEGAAGGGNGTCKSATLAGVKKNEQAEQAMKEEREHAKLKNKVPKEEFIGDLGQARHTNSTGKTEKPSGFSETRSQYEGEKTSDAEEEPRIIVQGEDAQSDLYRGRSQVDVKSILDPSDEPEPRSLEESNKAVENDDRVLLDEPLEYELTVNDKEEPVEVGDILDVRPISLTERKKNFKFSRDTYDYEAPRRSDYHYRDIDGRRRNSRPLYEELKKVYDWSEDVRDRPRFRGDLRMRFEMDDNRESKDSAVPSVQPNPATSNTSKSNYLALKSTDDLFKSGIEQSNSSDDKKTADQKSSTWKVMKVVPTDNPHAKLTTDSQSFLEQRKYPEMDSLSPYANSKYIESIKSQDRSRNVGREKQLSLESKDLHESFVDPVDWMDDLDDDVRLRLGRSLMAVESSANRLPKTIENMPRSFDDSNENTLSDIEGMESDLLSYLPESGLAKIRVKRRTIDDDFKQSAAKKYSTNRNVDVEEGVRLNEVQEKNANAERDLVHGKVERDMPRSGDVIEASLNNAKKYEVPDDETVKNVNGERERNSNYATRSNVKGFLDDGSSRFKRGAANYHTLYDDVNEGWRESSESAYNKYFGDKRDIRFHPAMSSGYDQSYDQRFDGFFVPEWNGVPLYNNSTEELDRDGYGKVVRSVSPKKGKSGQHSAEVAKKHVDSKHKQRKDRHRKRSSYDSEEYLEDEDWKLDEDDEIMNPFASEADKHFRKVQNIIFESSVEPPRKTRKAEDENQQKKLQSLLTVDNMEDESQMNMALHGELAGKIVEKIFEQVQGNEALKVALGPGLYRKHKPEDAATVDKNYRQGLNQDEVKHTEAMMKRVMELLGRLVLDEVQRKTCASLPPDLSNFLHWMLGVDKGREQLEEAPPLPHVRHEQTSERHPNDKFLFHGAMNNEPELELAELYGKVRVLQDLIKEYNALSEIEKEKVRTVYDYLERQINLLLDYIRAKEMKQAEMKEMSSEEGALARNDNLLQFQSAVPKESNERNMTMPESFSRVANMPDFLSLNDTALNGDYKNLLDEINESDRTKYRSVRSSDGRKRKKHKKRKRKHRKHRKHKGDFGRSKYRDTIHDVDGFRRKRANLKENEWNPFESSHGGLLRDDKREFVSKETDVLTDNNNVSTLDSENLSAKNPEAEEGELIDESLTAPKEYYLLKDSKTDEITGDIAGKILDETSDAKYQDSLPIKGKDAIDDEVLLLTKREAWKRENERQLEEVAFGKDMRSNAREEEQFRRLTEIDKKKDADGENLREKRENMAMSARHLLDDENDVSNDLTAGTSTNYTKLRNERNQLNEHGKDKVSYKLPNVDVTLFKIPSRNTTSNHPSSNDGNHHNNQYSTDDERLQMLEKSINVYSDTGMTTDVTLGQESFDLKNERNEEMMANLQTLIP